VDLLTAFALFIVVAVLKWSHSMLWLQTKSPWPVPYLSAWTRQY